MIGAQPMDGCILIGGCDKTVPAQLMGATSANILTAQLVTGPMSTDNFKGESVRGMYRLSFQLDEISIWVN